MSGCTAEWVGVQPLPPQPAHDLSGLWEPCISYSSRQDVITPRSWGLHQKCLAMKKAKFFQKRHTCSFTRSLSHTHTHALSCGN